GDGGDSPVAVLGSCTTERLHPVSTRLHLAPPARPVDCSPDLAARVAYRPRPPAPDGGFPCRPRPARHWHCYPLETGVPALLRSPSLIVGGLATHPAGGVESAPGFKIKGEEDMATFSERMGLKPA